MSYDDPYDAEVRLCDDAGMVSDEQVVQDPMPAEPETYLERHNRLSGQAVTEPYACTGHAHFRDYGHLRCTSPAHAAPTWP